VDLDLGQALEGGVVGGHDVPTGRTCSRSDDHVMRATGSPGPPHVGEQIAMDVGYVAVVAEHRNPLLTTSS
jgi:hypothetical protein